jgi:hypothetical protein
MHKKINVRTYADCGRIATSTIQKVAISHIATGNIDLSLKALKELENAIVTEYRTKYRDYETLLKIASTQNTTEGKQRLLIKNKFRFDTSPAARIRTIAPIPKKGVQK